jgi:glycosyltransferase involved in cell wall biosynthesis
MRILFLASSFPTKENQGKGVFNYRLVKQLSEYAEINVISIRTIGLRTGFIKNRNFQGIEVTEIFLPIWPRVNNRFWLHVNGLVLSFASQILNIKFKPDIIHSVYLTINGIFGVKLANKYRIPHLVQLIGSDVNSDLQNIYKPRWFKEISSGLNGFICNSNALKDEISKYLKLENIEIPVRTIYRGINQEGIMESTSLDSDPLRIRILFLGGFPEYKGFKFGRNTKGGLSILEALPHLPSEILSKIEVRLAGPETDNITNLSAHLSKEIRAMILNIGNLSKTEVDKELNEAHILLIPSMEEGLPNVLLEGGIRGKVVLASRVGGIPEVLEDGKEGVLFEAGNAVEMATKLEELVRNWKSSRKFGNALKLKVKREFNSDSYARNLMEFYKSLV